MRLLILTLISLLLMQILPVGAAAFPIDVDPAPLHVGDRMLYRTQISERDSDGGPGYSEYEWQGQLETFVMVEGRATALDEYGIEREAVAFHIERSMDRELVSVERCFAEPRMGWAMRWDFIEGGPSYAREWQFSGEDPVFGSQTQYYNSTPVSEFRRGQCDGYWEPPTIWGPLIQEGESIDYRLVESSRDFRAPIWASDSLLATATTWNGFPAVEYVFPLSAAHVMSVPPARVTGEMRYTFADGFPGAVLGTIEMQEFRGDVSRSTRVTRELVGYRPGGEPFPYDIPWREVPDTNPRIGLVPTAPLSVPDAALGLSYPFAEALHNLASDPRISLGAWLGAHPDAGIAAAWYNVETHVTGPRYPNPLGGTLEVAGPGWSLCLVAGGDEICAKSAFPEGLDPGFALNELIDDQGNTAAVQVEYPAVSSAGVAELVFGSGIDSASIRAVSYRPYLMEDRDGGATVHAVMTVSEVGWSDVTDVAGRIVDLDVARGAVSGIQAASVEVGTTGGAVRPIFSEISPPRGLQRAPPTMDWEDAFTLAPRVAATLVGLGILALIAKVMLPLFSRIRRGRVLDHPVRRRIYDQIRDEPGIHLRALESALGLARGATRHHVDQLTRHKLVFVLTDEGFVRCYAAGQVPFDHARQIGLLRGGSHAAVYALFKDTPHLSLREAARRLRMSAPSVYKAKRRLESEGLLAGRTGEGNTPRGLVGSGMRKA